MNSPHKGQWRGALMFSLICVCINGWVNNREAGDLRRHRAHYDVIVMALVILFCCSLALTEAYSDTHYDVTVMNKSPHFRICYCVQLLFKLVWCIIPLNMLTKDKGNQLGIFRSNFTNVLAFSLHWRHNERDSVSNHQPHDCLLSCLFRRKENTKALRHWPLCGEFIGDQWIPRTKGR